MFGDFERVRPGTDFHELWEERAANRDMQRESTSARELQSQLDKLQLICMAMWSLLKEKTGTTEAELLKRVEEIDLSDGRLDGKVRTAVSVCPQCNRALSTKHNRCLYCGYIPPAGDFSAFLTTPPSSGPQTPGEGQP